MTQKYKNHFEAAAAMRDRLLGVGLTGDNPAIVILDGMANGYIPTGIPEVIQAIASNIQAITKEISFLRTGNYGFIGHDRKGGEVYQAQVAQVKSDLPDMKEGFLIDIPEPRTIATAKHGGPRERMRGDSSMAVTAQIQHYGDEPPAKVSPHGEDDDTKPATPHPDTKPLKEEMAKKWDNALQEIKAVGKEITRYGLAFSSITLGNFAHIEPEREIKGFYTGNVAARAGFSPTQ